MNITDKIKGFFYIGERKRPSVAAEAGVIDKLLDYTVSQILHTDLIKPQLDRIEAAKTLMPTERVKGYCKIYLELEKFIVEHEPLVVKRKYTVDEFRIDIKEKFGSLGVDLDLMLAKDIEQVSRLCEIMCQSILNQTTTVLGQVASQGFMDKAGVTGFRAAEFRAPEQVISSFRKLLSDLYIAISETIGKEKAKSMFEADYKELQETYGFIPYTTEILKALPAGILEEDKIKVIGRLELEEKVKERTRELEKATEEKVKLVAAAAAEKARMEAIEKSKVDLEEKAKKLADSRSAMIYMLKDVDKTSKELAAARDYADNIIKSMIDTLIVVDPDANIKTINKATSDLLGYKEEELIGKPVGTIFAEEEEEEEEAMPFKGTRLKRLIEEGSIRDYDMTYKTKTGEKIPVSFSGSVMYETTPVTGARNDSEIRDTLRQSSGQARYERPFDRAQDRRIIGVVGIARDVREMKRLMQKEKELAAAAAAAADAGRKRAADLERSQDASLNIMEDLERRRKELDIAIKKLGKTQAALVQSERLAALGQLGAGVAHELNSPLAGILELVRSFLKETDKEDPNYSYFEDMKGAAEHAAKIVADLTAFSRESEEAFEPLKINDVIEGTLSFSKHDIERRGIKIVKNFSEDLPLISGDKKRLQQVVLNMLTNARDAIEARASRPRKEIVISAGKSDDRKFVELAFKDNGYGIPDDVIDRIFEPFFTTKDIGEGVGLGLSICHGIITGHKGTIKVQSKVGEGTTFTIKLPVIKPQRRQIKKIARKKAERKMA